MTKIDDHTMYFLKVLDIVFCCDKFSRPNNTTKTIYSFDPKKFESEFNEKERRFDPPDKSDIEKTKIFDRDVEKMFYLQRTLDLWIRNHHENEIPYGEYVKIKNEWKKEK